MNSLCETHWKAVKRILRYLSGTLYFGLIFRASGDFSLVCYANADWAASVDDRRSTNGYCVYLGGNLIKWCSKKQSVVSKSTSEAEYRSLANPVAELIWVEELLGEIGVDLHGKPVWKLFVNFLPSTEQVTDLLSKPIPPAVFPLMRDRLGVVNLDRCFTGAKKENQENDRIYT
ncbi:secreted RxLR effector protein 161-like [Hibiscus syriacus]|uniref:secreted RxLR effector protein 161-like n=1 Tax=Hibiscus syriacus TaxID=106335 RepID=UPI001923D478|nr:secreted RxLR effector protein 161-like [Hibiscus syriacus]